MVDMHTGSNQAIFHRATEEARREGAEGMVDILD